MKAETIRKMIAKNHGGVNAELTAGLASMIAEEIARIEKIKESIGILRAEEKAAKKHYDDRMNALNDRLLAIQAECPHYEMTRHTGSGNNDSYSQCDLCGKDFE